METIETTRARFSRYLDSAIEPGNFVIGKDRWKDALVVFLRDSADVDLVPERYNSVPVSVVIVKKVV